MSRTPRSYADIAAARKAAILSGAPIHPKGTCHMCDFHVEPKALWCSTLCAQEFHAEKAELLANKPAE